MKKMKKMKIQKCVDFLPNEKKNEKQMKKKHEHNMKNMKK